MSLRIDVIPNRNSTPQILLRKSWREGKRVRHKNVLNLTNVPAFVTDAIRAVLKGGIVLSSIHEAFTIERSLPHGHVAAALHVARSVGLPRILWRQKNRLADLALAGIISRLVNPASKLATAGHLSAESATTSLGVQLDLGQVSGNEMLAMLDWLALRQRHIESALANRHLDHGTLILYDVSSSYVEGRCCALADFGYNRDRKRGKRQIVYGLLCNRHGCPIAIEVFKGNSADPVTLASQVERIRKRFRINEVALVGDRGMLTTARINADLKPAQLNWISALTSANVKKLLRRHPTQTQAVVDPKALVPDQVAEVCSADFPGERLMVCLNPRRREDRARKREALLDATEKALRKIADAGKRRKPGQDNRDRMNAAIGAEVKKWKVLKHFNLDVRDDGMDFSRNAAHINEQAVLDGIYVIRTALDADAITADQAVQAYKSLSAVERAFRLLKTDRLQIRPLYVYNESRVRGHVFLCMLACYLEWHMRQRLAPLLFEDDDPQAAAAKRKSPIAKAEVSDEAKRKADTRRTADGHRVHSMSSLMAHLATFTLNRVSLPSQPGSPFMMTSQLTPIQKRAFDLIDHSQPHEVFTVR